LLRGPYKRNEYRKVILPLTVLRRFDGLLAPTNAKALETSNQYKSKPESIVRSVMQGAPSSRRCSALFSPKVLHISFEGWILSPGTGCGAVQIGAESAG